MGYKKIQYPEDVIELYEMVLSGHFKTFPKGFWQNPEAVQNSIKCTKHLIENILKWNEEDIKDKLCLKTFRDYKLGTMIRDHSCPYMAIKDIYPNIKPWELTVSPDGFLDKEENRKIMIKWLIEEKMKWDEEEIKKNLSSNTFKDNGLHRLLLFYYGGSPYDAIKELYPNINPWELKNCPRHFWNDENSKIVIKWLFEEKLKWSVKEIEEKFNTSTLIENGLRQLVKRSTIKEIKELYLAREN